MKRSVYPEGGGHDAFVDDIASKTVEDNMKKSGTIRDENFAMKEFNEIKNMINEMISPEKSSKPLFGQDSDEFSDPEKEPDGEFDEEHGLVHGDAMNLIDLKDELEAEDDGKDLGDLRLMAIASDNNA